jgi:hypothetical protein
MKFTKASLFLAATAASFQLSTAFSPIFTTSTVPSSSSLFSSPLINSARVPRIQFSLKAAADDDDEEEEKVENPYADPNYPDLEFINYDDPEYIVDQGITDEMFQKNDDDTDEKIEEMREDRRRKNDEFQFETYHADTLKSGDMYKGEWTVYRTSTFLDGVEEDEDVAPRFKKEKKVRKVVSNGKKIMLEEPEDGFEYRVDGERLVHEERLAEVKDFEDDEEWEDYISDDDGDDSKEDDSFIGSKRYWPEQISARDFRGEAGIMCVGNCFTICDSVALDGEVKDDYDGPFSELRTEIGIQYKRLRFRVKWDYRVKEEQLSHDHPALYLYSMIVCRETRERWPRYETKSNVDDSITETLFGNAGAPGGLYDRPPVGSDAQAMQYMLLDLEGYASTLFPYKIDQDPEAFGGNGWVQSLDWSPGRIRYQADRKVLGGAKVRGLKTLELSEVEADAADQWRPKDQGEDMRQ